MHYVMERIKLQYKKGEDVVKLKNYVIKCDKRFFMNLEQKSKTMNAIKTFEFQRHRLIFCAFECSELAQIRNNYSHIRIYHWLAENILSAFWFSIKSKMPKENILKNVVFLIGMIVEKSLRVFHQTSSDQLKPLYVDIDSPHFNTRSMTR